MSFGARASRPFGSRPSLAIDPAGPPRSGHTRLDDRQLSRYKCSAPAPAHWCRAEPAGMVTRLGVNAVKSLSNGETGVLVGYQKNEVTRTPLADIVGPPKPAEPERVGPARLP